VKKVLIIIGVLVLVFGGLFFYDYKSMKSNVNLCMKIDEINFKEAWNDECSRMGLGWDCNLPAQNPNREAFLQQVEKNSQMCFEKHMKFKIFTFLNFFFEPAE